MKKIISGEYRSKTIQKKINGIWIDCDLHVSSHEIAFHSVSGEHIFTLKKDDEGYILLETNKENQK